MSQTITIPEADRPLFVEINGVKTTLPAGQTISVPNEIAELIANNEALKPTPAVGRPEGMVPRILAEDEGKVLKVVGGMAVWADADNEETSSGPELQ